METEIKAIMSDAQELVSNHCSQLVMTISEMDYIGHEREAVLQLTTAQLLNAIL